MNTKKLLNILSILVMVIMIVSLCSNVYAAANEGPVNPSTLKGTQTSDFDDLGKTIIGGIQAVGSIVSVAILVVLGVKYMMGSAEEKAEYKKTMIPYIVGAILVFAASNIAGFIFSFAGKIS